MYINLDDKPDISEIKKRVEQLSENIDELKEEIFSLTIDVERLQECEKMEQEEKLEENKRYIVHKEIGDLQEYVVSTLGENSINIKNAKEFTKEEAIKVRNEKNKHCENCLTQWVISEVK